MKNPVIMHINYAELQHSLLAMSIFDICQKAKEWGFDGVEFRGKIPTNIDADIDTYLNQIAAAKKETGLEHVLFGYAALGIANPDKAVRDKAVSDAIVFFEKANKICGTTICNVFADDTTNPAAGSNYNLSGSFYATEEQWMYTVEGYKKIGEACDKLGMKLAFETHMNFIHDIPKASKKLVDLIDSPAVGINMDYGNTVYFINIPSAQETVKMYGDKLYYMHLKNSWSIGETRFPVALAEGCINHRVYLKTLLEVGYDGPIGIEAPRSGDREWFARQDLAYFKAVAEEIGLK